MDKKLKICFYTNSVFSFGGVQRVLAVIATELSKNHDVTILTMDDPLKADYSIYDLHKTSIHFEFIRYSSPTKWEWLPCKLYSFLYKIALKQTPKTTGWYEYSSFPYSQRKKLIQFINIHRFDIVIGVHAFLSFHLAAIKPRIKARIIGWMHNSFEAFFENKDLYLWGQKKRFAYTMKKLDQLIVLSQCDQKRYKNEMQLDTTVIYNPLTISPQGKGSFAHKKFIAVGRLNYQHKGFDILIRAFHLFSQHNQDWSLNIIGEGPDRPFLQKLISKFHLDQRITISPFTKNIGEFYARSSIYILSSRWEGLPLVLMESLSYGLPVISSELPITKELLSECKAVRFFKSENYNDLAKIMEEMTKCQTDYEYMSNNGSDYVNNFDLKIIFGQWISIIDR